VAPEHPHETLRRFFAGLTEYAFESRLGVADVQLVDYMTDLLARFVRLDAMLSLRDLSGGRLDDVAHMMFEAEARIGEAKRKALRHIGDFTLFWTGVYPERLKQQGRGQRHDYFVDYCTHGKRSYKIASTIPVGEPDAEAEILERLSHDFELCVYGLNEVRREWERREPPIGGGGIVLGD
jgi:hypothetical protein